MEKTRLFYDAMLYAMEGEDPSKAIDNLEKREQRKAVSNHRLPKRMNDMSLPSHIMRNGVTKDMDYETKRQIVDKNNLEYTKNQYEVMGIKILEDYDDLLYTVELPEGWELKPTDHLMYSEVVDNKGRKRISMMYKGAFWDRDGWCSFINRYSFAILPFDDYQSDVTYEERKYKPWTLYLTDSGKKMETVREICPTTEEEYFALDDILRSEGLKLLDEKYPDWRDINAYWD